MGNVCDCQQTLGGAKTLPNTQTNSPPPQQPPVAPPPVVATSPPPPPPQEESKPEEPVPEEEEKVEVVENVVTTESPIEKVKVGATAKRTYKITDEMIKRFVAASGDDNPVHLNNKAAQEMGFEKRLAHGVMSECCLGAVVFNDLPGRGWDIVNQQTEYKAPALLGDSITATIKVISVDTKKGLVHLQCTATNQKKIEVLKSKWVVTYKELTEKPNLEPSTGGPDKTTFIPPQPRTNIKVGDATKRIDVISYERIQQLALAIEDQSSLDLEASPEGKRFNQQLVIDCFFSAIGGGDLPGNGSILLNQNAQYKAPVYPNDVITTIGEVIKIQKDKKIVTMRFPYTNQRGEEVLVVESSVMVPATKL